MPKVQKLKRQRLVNVATPYPKLDPKQIEQSSSDGLNLSKGQKRRQLRNNQVLRKLGKDSTFTMKQNDDPVKNKKVDFALLLNELESSLPIQMESEKYEKAIASIRTNKMKKTVAVRETERMKLVQQHPAFQSDPIAAMKSHIEMLVSSSKPAIKNEDKLKNKGKK